MQIILRKSFSILLFTVVVFAMVAGAQDVAINSLPDAPLPELPAVHGVIKNAPTSPPATRHRLFNLNNFSIATLIAGEALDSWSTHNNLTHPRWICGYSAAFGDAATYISNDGRHYDAETIQHVLCGPGPSGQLANYAYDVTRTGAFTEQGWTTQFHLAGNRDFASVEAWNLANDFGQLLVAHYLHKRKGPFRWIGPAMNFSHGSVHLECGILNIRFAREHSNAGSWQFGVPDESRLYPGPRWWGRQ